MDDPLANIEQAKAQQDLGVAAYRIYQGARSEGASRTEAILIVYAWFRGLTAANEEEEEEGT